MPGNDARPASAAVSLVPLRPHDAEALRELEARNRRFLEPWMPERDDEWFSLESRRRELLKNEAEHTSGAGYHFAMNVEGRLVGRIDLSNVVHGVWQNTNLGYWVSEDCGGRGYATSAVRAATDFAFAAARLHRVQAAVISRNARSLRVMQKAGFRREGVALRYLRINGAWEDHVIFAITSEEWRQDD